VPPEHTFYQYVRCLACRGIVSGYGDGTFRPNNDVTRGQTAKVVSNAAGFSEPVAGQTYEDVPSSHTFYEWIERLSGRGVMGGYPCGQREQEPCFPGNRPYFRPAENATRGQVSKIVSSAANLQDPVSGQFYTDVPGDNPFYLWIMRLTDRGVMSGYACGGINPQTGQPEPCDTDNRPYFRWGNYVTRGQSSKIVANTFFPNCFTP
jgi:5'-nucleotidase/2',3'-cyclic-nucleotide 2'-phosphodiesterase/3'-nucleotidase/5'-nucleotidase